MEQQFPTDQGHARAVLESQLRECFGRVVYSHKTHEKCANLLLARLSGIKFWQIVLSSIPTAGFIGVFLGRGTAGAVTGVIVATVLMMLNAYTKDYDLGEPAQKHRQAAAELWMFRERYLALLTDLRASTSTVAEINKRRDDILEELHAVYSGAPSTTFKAYKMAQEGLQQHDEMSFSDEDIDKLLPEVLKKQQAALAAGDSRKSLDHE